MSDETTQYEGPIHEDCKSSGDDHHSPYDCPRIRARDAVDAGSWRNFVENMQHIRVADKGTEDYTAGNESFWQQVRDDDTEKIRDAETDEQSLDRLLEIVVGWGGSHKCPWAVEAYKARMGITSASQPG